MIQSSVHDVDTTVVASYFPLPQCLEGLNNVLVESLFGATFHTVPMAPGESWHPDVLKMSLHHPDEGARNMFAATELQCQVFYALIDQMLFGEQPETSRDVGHLVVEQKRQHTSWSHVEGTHWQIRFSHLPNAGYYSYLYVKCFLIYITEGFSKQYKLGE